MASVLKDKRDGVEMELHLYYDANSIDSAVIFFLQFNLLFHIVFST